jgi:hypothetical protein
MNAVSLHQFMTERRNKSPLDLVWPPTLPIELALKTATPEEIRQEYGYSDEEWAALPHNPAFMKDLTDACELVRQEGMSFKLKARLLAEENLKTTWRLIHASADEVPASVKADLIKALARWAGFEQKPGSEGGGAVQANTLNIQINLGDGY